MTNREFFTAIVSADVSDELTAFAQEAIAKLDKRNASRSSKPSKVALDNIPVKEAILAFVEENEDAIASAIATGCKISVQKASSLCHQLVEEGQLTSQEVKVPKRGKVKAYRLA